MLKAKQSFLFLLIINSLFIFGQDTVQVKSKYKYLKGEDRFSIGLSFLGFLTSSISEQRFVIIDSTYLELESGDGGGYSYGIPITYFFFKRVGLITGFYKNSYSIANDYEYTFGMDTSLTFHPGYQSISSEFRVESITVPIHAIIRTSRPFGVTVEFGMSFEIPLNMSYKEDYTKKYQEKTIAIDESIPKEYLSLSYNFDFRFGFHYKIKKFDAFIKLGITQGITNIISDYKERAFINQKNNHVSIASYNVGNNSSMIIQFGAFYIL